MAQQKFKVSLPTGKGITSSDRVAIGIDIIEFIRARTVSGKDKKNKNFPKYTKIYATKKGQKNVDLVLSAEMLEALKILNQRSGSVTIGYDDGTRANDKAEGNIKGTYGQKTPIKGKKRDFLGISPGFLKQIVRENVDGGSE